MITVFIINCDSNYTVEVMITLTFYVQNRVCKLFIHFFLLLLLLLLLFLLMMTSSYNIIIICMSMLEIV